MSVTRPNVRCYGCNLQVLPRRTFPSTSDARYTCSSCENTFVIEKDQLKSVLDDKITELESRLAFLRLYFDSDLTEGIIPKQDVAILVKDEEKPLYAHKMVLANRSSVFRKMFQTEMLERETGNVRIDDATLPVIRAMIQFCYRAEIDFSEEVTAEDMLSVAHKYAIDFLLKTCEQHLAKAIDKVNLPKMLKLAKKFEAKELQKEAVKYLKAHYDDEIFGVLDEIVLP